MNFLTTAPPAPKDAVPAFVDITLGTDESRRPARKAYWRALVGVSGDTLVISALSTPPNPVYTSRPPAAAPAVPDESESRGRDSPSFGAKIAHLFRHDKQAPNATPITEFPGMIDGKPLAAITVPVSCLDTKRYTADTKSSTTFLELPVVSPTLEGTGSLRFEFDNWLSSKADVEILGTCIDKALHCSSADQVAAAPAAEPISQLGARLGRDQDGSTHPSGDAPYREGWQKDWQKDWHRNWRKD